MPSLRRDVRGLTMIELLVVLVVVGLLIAIAVPSYTGYKRRAEKSVAQANVHAARAAMHLYFASNSTYVGGNLTALRSIDKGLASVTISNLTVSSYRISFTKGACWARVIGANGAMTSNC